MRIGLFNAWPERPRPAEHAIVGTAAAVATASLGPILMQQHLPVAPLVGLGAVGGFAVGSAFAVLETFAPARSDITGVARSLLMTTTAAVGGVGLGAMLAERAGWALLAPSLGLEVGAMGTCVLLIGSVVTVLVVVLVGLPDEGL